MVCPKALFGGVIGVLVTATIAFASPVLEVYTSPNCPACKAAEPFLASLEAEFTDLRIQTYDLFVREDRQRLLSLAKARGIDLLSTPSFYFEGQLWIGDSAAARQEIRSALSRSFDPEATVQTDDLSATGPQEAIRIPGIGVFTLDDLGLPLLTVVLGLLDSINPCAFFVLLFILSFLAQAGSRKRMMLVGGVFVLISGLVYFLFMAAWLNLFLLFGNLELLTRTAGLLAILIACINIKDFFLFKKGFSLSLSDKGRKKVTGLARRVRASATLPALLLTTVLMALIANTYELFCTAGFPMIYTRALTLHALPTLHHYSYLVAYNLVYILPLLTIVFAFAWTLGARKLSQWEGRILKLFAGMMMALMGLTLLIRPALLTTGLTAIVLPAVALGITLLLVLLFRTRFHS